MLRMSQVWSRLRLQASKESPACHVADSERCVIMDPLVLHAKGAISLVLRAVDSLNNLHLQSERRFPPAV